MFFWQTIQSRCTAIICDDITLRFGVCVWGIYVVGAGVFSVGAGVFSTCSPIARLVAVIITSQDVSAPGIFLSGTEE